MSSSGKQRKHKEKMARKRATKAAKRTKYAALAGTSKKAKRQVKRKSGPSNGKHAHLMLNCGNIGCKKCFPRLNIA